MKRIVVLTGAGISAESGISTFRDAGGLWEGYDVMEVASPEGWQSNPDLVLDFYNQRRRQALEVKPNKAHLALVELEARYDVQIITQNVDDLHERAGSRSVLHLHGELFKVRSTGLPDLIYDWRTDLRRTDLCEAGYPLRPHIVWFGEEVPALQQALPIMLEADIVLIVGTSLQVYPAAGLIHFAPVFAPIHYVDPVPAPTQLPDHRVLTYPTTATEGVPQLVTEWLQKK